MSRPQNTELKSKITRVARKQFKAQGYTATSYTTIAKECGISRNLVQYHFPKKEDLAIGFMEDLLARSQAALGYSNEQITGNFQHIYELGCCYFIYLLNRGYGTFLLDIIESREMTESVLAFNGGWALARTGAKPLTGKKREAAMQEVIVHMGGFYELLYHCLRNGLEFDITKHLANVMRGFVGVAGISPQQAASMLRSSKRAENAAANM